MKITFLILLVIIGVQLNAQKIIEETSFRYSIENDWFVSESCDKYEDGDVICETDSVLTYTPIKYFLNKAEPCEEDTLLILGYSTVLKELGEPKIYNRNFDYEIYRFSWFRDTLPEIYRVEIYNGKIKIVYKKTSGNFDINAGEIIIEKEKEIPTSKFRKLLSILEKGGYWSMDDDTDILGRDILIEHHKENNYYFINKNAVEIKNKNRHLLKCFHLLESMVAE